MPCFSTGLISARRLPPRVFWIGIPQVVGTALQDEPSWLSASKPGQGPRHGGISEAQQALSLREIRVWAGVPRRAGTRTGVQPTLEHMMVTDGGVRYQRRYGD